MRAKCNFSQLIEDTAEKGSIAIFAGVAAFIGAFAAWSATCIGGAIYRLFYQI